MKHCIVKLAHIWASLTQCFINLARFMDGDGTNTVSCCDNCESQCCNYMVKRRSNNSSVAMSCEHLSQKLRSMHNELLEDIEKMKRSESTSMRR